MICWLFPQMYPWNCKIRFVVQNHKCFWSDFSYYNFHILHILFSAWYTFFFKWECVMWLVWFMVYNALTSTFPKMSMWKVNVESSKPVLQNKCAALMHSNGSIHYLLKWLQLSNNTRWKITHCSWLSHFFDINKVSQFRIMLFCNTNIVSKWMSFQWPDDAINELHSAVTVSLCCRVCDAEKLLYKMYKLYA